MTDTKEERIPKFNDKPEESFHLWRLRMEAIFENRECMGILDGSELVPSDDLDALSDYNKKRKRAVALMVLALGDKPLKAVQKYSKDPKEMWTKLTGRYAGKTTSNKLSLMNEIFSRKLEHGESISDHIAELELSFTKLENAGQKIQDLMQVSILLSSLKECDEYESTIAAIKTMDEEKATWDAVSNRLIDEYKERSSLKNIEEVTSIAATAKGGRKYRKWNNSGRNYNRGNGQYNRNQSYNSTGNVNPKGTQFSSNRKEQAVMPKPRIAITKITNISSIENKNEMDKNLNLKEWFVLDSGATHHICCDREMISNLYKSKNEIQLGNNSIIHCEYQGNVDLICGDTQKWIRLQNVIFAPTMSLNLLSVPRLDHMNISVLINNGKSTLKDNINGQNLAYAVLNNTGLYILNARPTRNSVHPKSFNVSVSSFNLPHNEDKVSNNKSSKHIWHLRLGHVNENKISEMIKSPHILGMKSLKAESIKCQPCALGKQAQDPHKGQLVPTYYSVGDVIFMDVCGPLHERTWGNSRYFLLFIDGASRYTWVTTLKQKSDASKKIEHFINKFHTLYGAKIKRIHTDNGGEFRNKHVNSILNRRGINHSFTSAYNPQSNGIVERMNRTIMERVRCMLSSSKLSNKFWGEAVLTAVDIQNIIPTKILGNISPYEALNGTPPNISHFRVFGCQALVTIPGQKRKKLSMKAKPMILMGMVGKTMYKMFDPESKHIEYVRHARFDEYIYPGYKHNEREVSTSDNYVTVDIASENTAEEFHPTIDQLIHIPDQDNNDDTEDGNEKCSNVQENGLSSQETSK